MKPSCNKQYGYIEVYRRTPRPNGTGHMQEFGGLHYIVEYSTAGCDWIDFYFHFNLIYILEVIFVFNFIFKNIFTACDPSILTNQNIIVLL